MRYFVIIAAITCLAVSCKSKQVATTDFKNIDEVEGTSMDAQNYNTKMRPATDTIRFKKPAADSLKN
jgi:hypothetical protein